MPTFSYVCKKGHVTDVDVRVGETRPARVSCRYRNRRRALCGSGAKYSLLATHAGGGAKIHVIPGVAEHFNISLNTYVHGSRHLRELQRIHGTQTYEPVKRHPGRGSVGQQPGGIPGVIMNRPGAFED